MKYYPVHIIIKELSFWISFVQADNIIYHYQEYHSFQHWWRAIKIIGPGIYMSAGPILINLVIFSIIYIVLKRKGVMPKSFAFGVSLHGISLLLIWFILDLTDRHLTYLVAAIISLPISGYTYKKLNAECTFEMVKEWMGVKYREQSK